MVQYKVERFNRETNGLRHRQMRFNVMSNDLIETEVEVR